MCGEKSSQPYTPGSHTGSPPRVRGKGGAGKSQCNREGITPACAGKSPKPNPPAQAHKDHPRVCGEKPPFVNQAAVLLGSPPRVRGKALHVTDCGAKPGITPACAGKSNIIPHHNILSPDHPRVCGEKIILANSALTCMGSPPRVRGKVWKCGLQAPSERITPACAGKSLA